MREGDVAATYLRWIWIRAMFHRGWWLVASVYLVVVAELTPSELVFYGAVLALVHIVGEAPTGVVADAISRKRSLVIAHVVMGSGMALLGLVTAYPLILVSQVLWGLGWTFSSGADVAWMTDELDDEERIDGVLIARARWELFGAAVGLVGFGALGWTMGLGAAAVAAGLGMIALGGAVALRFSERKFVASDGARWRVTWSILRRGLALARGDRAIITVFAVTFLINAGGEAYGFLLPRRLLDLGFPVEPDPIVWFTALGLVTLAVGAAVLRLVEQRIARASASRGAYALACGVGSLGLLLLAGAPEEFTGMAGVLFVDGASRPVTSAIGIVWVNQRATSEVRATLQSFLTQAEVFGEVSAGLGFALLAHAVDIPVILVCSASLLALAGVLAWRSSAGRVLGAGAVEG